MHTASVETMKSGAVVCDGFFRLIPCVCVACEESVHLFSFAPAPHEHKLARFLAKNETIKSISLFGPHVYGVPERVYMSVEHEHILWK